MKSGTHRFSKVLAFGLALIVLCQPLAIRQASAQNVPASWECMIQPAGFLDILALLNDVPDSRYSDRLDSVSQLSIVEGEPLSTQDQEELEWSLRQLVACGNSLDPLKVLPLLSEDFRAAVLASAVYDNDLTGVFEAIPLLAPGTIEQGGVEELEIVDSWYDPETNKRIWAAVELPVDPSAEIDTPRFLVSLLWDQYLFVIDSIWYIV